MVSINIVRGWDDPLGFGRAKLIILITFAIDMIQYPITTLSKEDWNKKVTATYMYSIPLEDEALPILEELVDLLEHLHSYPLPEVMAEEHT